MKSEDIETVLADMKKELTRSDPFLQAKISVSVSRLLGSAELAAYRGWHIGIHDAFLSIRELYPQAADAILEIFSMDREGGMKP